MCNIYGLEGGGREYTAELYDSHIGKVEVIRGGVGSSWDTSPASYRDYDNESSIESSYRLVLYIII